MSQTTEFQVAELKLDTQKEYDGSCFPLILECQSPDADLETALAWVHENRQDLDAKAAKHGSILFRNFPTKTDQDFDAFIRAFDYPNFKYEDSLSNAVRTNRTDRVFTANEAPPEVTIYLHHEMAQTPIYPSKLLFFCEKAAEEGGATPLCRSDVLMEKLYEELPEFAKNCEEKGLHYSNVMPGVNDAASGMGRSWQSTWSVETREQAEARMTELGYTWEWLDDGCLRATTPILQGVRDLGDGRKAFFNQLIAAFQGWKDTRNDPAKAITFGDGSPLDPADAKRAAELAEEITFDVPWQNGDVALVDNYVAMHGRRTFSGTRRVLASLVAS
ncbi:MAG: TauD/TfdA family dioxygenase [Verrucomicrobiae bacterium]|nr:TauD/TfdA family dioxygenase [Verrucomicrobiae bacterium]